MAVERPFGLALVAMKVVVVAMFVVTAAFAPARFSAPMDPVMAAIVDRGWDVASPAAEPQVKVKPHVEVALRVTTPAATPTGTLPPTDTASPAVDGRH